MILRIKIIIICLKFFVASSPLIPFKSQQYYTIENKVSIKNINHVSRHETSYTFYSDLKINSVWNNDDEQILEVYFANTHVSAPNKNGQMKVQELEKFPDRPFYITFVGNKPNKIIAHTSRDQSLLNMERAIASLLQIHIQNGPTTEVDISGICNNFYNIKSSTKIDKIKSDCSHWDLKVIYRGEKPLGVNRNSLETVHYDLSADGLLLTASSAETHKISLEANPEVGSHVESLFVIKHKTFLSEPAKQLPSKSSEDAVRNLLDWYRVFDIEADVDGVISELKDVKLTEQIESLKNRLKHELIGKVALAEAFVELIPVARVTKKEEFVKILKSNKGMHFHLVDLLGATQTLESHNAITEVFDFNSKSDEELIEKYLQSLSVGTHPERPIIEQLFKILSSGEVGRQNQQLEDTILQCVASLSHQFGFDVNDELFINIRQFILNQLLNGCEEELCQTRYLRALQNLQDSTTISILLNYAHEEEPKISVAAMQTLKSFSVVHFNEVHRQVFTNIFFQIKKKYDSTARILALDILLALKPTPLQLGQLLDYLVSTDHQFEIKTYVIQKLNMLSEKCTRFRGVLKSALLQRPHVNNYNIFGQKGLTTVLLRGLSWNPAFNESLLSTQEIYRGVLKRGTVETILSAGNNEIGTFKLGIYTSGLTSFIGDSDEGEEADVGPATAGMEIAVQGVQLRPLVFFTGQSELMSHIWSGTASEPTPAFQATTLSQDHEQYIILSSGSTVHMQVIGVKSFDLNGKVDLSIWNRNANTEIYQNTAIAVRGIVKAGFTYAFVSDEFLLTYEPRISLHADLDFYSGIKLCMQLQRIDMHLRHTNTKMVGISGPRKFIKKVLSKHSFKFPGCTLALNQKNNEMCNAILS